MRDDRVGQDLALAHELERASAVHPALAAGRIDAHVRAHRQVHVDLHRPRVPGDHADAAAALDVLQSFLHRGRAAGTLEDAIGAPAARDLAHAIAQVLVADVDRVVGAELFADGQTGVARPGQDDARGPEGLAELHRDEPDRAGALHQDGLAGDVAAHQVDRPERRGGGGDHASLLEREISRQLVKRVDVVHRVLGEPAVAGEPLRAVPLGDVAVVQAGGVPALDTVLAAVAALVDLDRDAIADAELVDTRTERGDGAGVLVAHHEAAGRLALQRAVQHLHVGAADRRDLDLQQHFTRARLGSRPGPRPHLVAFAATRAFHAGRRRHTPPPPAIRRALAR